MLHSSGVSVQRSRSGACAPPPGRPPSFTPSSSSTQRQGKETSRMWNMASVMSPSLAGCAVFYLSVEITLSSTRYI